MILDHDNSPRLYITGYNLNDIEHGPGPRCTIFLQGQHTNGKTEKLAEPWAGAICSKHAPPIDDLLDILSQSSNPKELHLTLAGGDALDQVHGTHCLLEAIKQDERFNLKSLVMYTARDINAIASSIRTGAYFDEYKQVISDITFIVSGPYDIVENNPHLYLRHSNNQRIFCVRTTDKFAAPEVAPWSFEFIDVGEWFDYKQYRITGITEDMTNSIFEYGRNHPDRVIKVKTLYGERYA